MAVRPQAGQIALGGGVLIHIGVHGRAHHHRRGDGQHIGRQGIVGNAVGQFGDAVGRGRRDHRQVGGLGPFDMPDGGIPLGKHTGADRLPRKGLKRARAHEPARVFRHDHPYPGPGFGQQAQQLDAFIGRDPPGHAQGHVFIIE